MARFDGRAILIVGVPAALVVWKTRPIPNPIQSGSALEVFRRQHGPDHASEREEESLGRDLFKDRRDRFFVDADANHYRRASGTYYLETQPNSSGIAIRPQESSTADSLRFSPRPRFLSFFVSGSSDEVVQLYALQDLPPVASADRDLVRDVGEPNDVRTVPTMTLNGALESERVQAADVASVEIEWHGPQALRGFDVEGLSSARVCIDGLLPVRQQILDYLADRPSMLVGT